MENIANAFSGKSKTIRPSSKPGCIIQVFRNDITAFNGERKETIPGKGEVCCQISRYLMQMLESSSIPTHFVEQLDATSQLVRHLTIIPIEVVVRNVAAGSVVKRGLYQKGDKINPPLVDFFYKSDALNDPITTREEIITKQWATDAQLDRMVDLAKQVNDILALLFKKAKICLVDFKLEFGVDEMGDIILADEISPDGCRLWDMQTQESLDKDRFRFDLGDVLTGYQEVAQRLKPFIPGLMSDPEHDE